MPTDAHIIVKDLSIGYEDLVIQKGLNFTIYKEDIFILMGGSGCGKSTLLRVLIGLRPPLKGSVFYGDLSFWEASAIERNRIMRRAGVLYQSGALWSSLTLAENIAVPLNQFTDLDPWEIKEIASLKLALVGLAGCEDYYPSELSGGMKKRAGLARAIALDPRILFFDEPGSGLDPISAKLLDDLIVELRDSLGATLVIVTHELDSIFAIGNNSIFLDRESKTMIAGGDPKSLLRHSDNPILHGFLTRRRALYRSPETP